MGKMSKDPRANCGSIWKIGTAALLAAAMTGAPAAAMAPEKSSGVVILAQANDFEEQLWQQVKDSGNAVLLETYIRSLPTGAHVPEAYAAIQALRAGKAGAAQPEPSGGATAEKTTPAPPAEAKAEQFRPGEGGWIGVELREATLKPDQLAVAGQERGISIVSVLSYGRGAAAGLKAGDIILALDGKKVGPVGDLVKAISGSKPGTTVALTLLRDLQGIEVEVTLGGRISDTIRAAEAGDDFAQLQLGFMYGTGQGLEKDEEQTLRWYLASANQGNRIAQYNMGNLYREGRGVPKDPVKAADWNRRSAEQGYSLAQTRMGYSLVNGHGVAKNEIQAVQWYEKAAEQKEPYALNNLGMMYIDGRGGLAKNKARGVELLREAAELGNELAKTNLKRMKLDPYDPAEIQGALADLGFDPGPVDGKMGSKTRRALRAFQERVGLNPNGDVTVELLDLLRKSRKEGRIVGAVDAGAGAVVAPAVRPAGGGALGDLDTLD